MAKPILDILAFRTRLAAIFSILAVALILYRLFDLQVAEPVVEPEVSEQRLTREMPWVPRRGLILDRNHRQLVRNDDRVTLKVELHRIQDRVAIAKALAPILERDSSLGFQEILKEIPKEAKDFKPGTYGEKNLVRHLSPSAVEALKDLKIPNLEKQEARFVQEAKGEIWRYRLSVPGLVLTGFPDRTYLKRQLAGQVLGFVDGENRGQCGIEMAENKQLIAKPIRIQARRYGDSRSILESDYTRGVPMRGADVVLTLDETIQWYAERALFDQCRELQAKTGIAIVVEPFNGNVLAMANYPPFEASKKGLYGTLQQNEHHSKNHAITDLFEPGSTLKPFIVAAGLDSGVITEESTFNLENGVRYIPGRSKPIKDVHPVKGMANVSEILVHSSNIGVGKIAEVIIGPRPTMPDRKILYDYLRGFGFGGRTGIILPGETPMYFRPANPADWKYTEIMTLAFGTGPIMVSPIGLAQAYCCLANGGIRKQPRIVDGYIGNRDGKFYSDPVASGERVVSQEVADSVRHMLRDVVESENSQAKSEWYDVGGKTGTALKWKVDHYSKDHRLLSFAGVAPIDEPKLVAVVMIDEPTGVKYGNQAAAPVFRRIVEDTLAYLHVRPDRVPEQTPTPALTLPVEEEEPMMARAEPEDPVLPPHQEESTAIPPAPTASEGRGLLSLLDRVAQRLGDEDESPDGRLDR
ncbi:MAG: penicillin-binding protein 2 [Candidatus Omnitrophica bacterium]|nr:penicillin-binding protein 2 [Candidatus Omnitrophota bacterium]